MDKKISLLYKLAQFFNQELNNEKMFYSDDFFGFDDFM